MADVNISMLVWGIVALFVLFRAGRAFLICLGVYKDPVFASFEHYGRERPYSPLYRLITWSAILLYLGLYLYVHAGVLLVAAAVMLVPLVSVRDSLQRALYKNPRWYRAFPVWYQELSARTTRNERRRIAYLWLRLPTGTQMRYSVSPPAFHHWLEMVLVTIAR